MELSWMGRYRPLIRAIVRNRNLFARAVNTKTENTGGETSLTIQEWIVLEYVIENEEKDDSMICISERLGLAPSSFSKITHTLCKAGLLAKYQMVGNKKNIIVRPTEEGRTFYLEHSAQLEKTIFNDFFNELEGLSDKDLACVARAIEKLDTGLYEETPKSESTSSQLVKIE